MVVNVYVGHMSYFHKPRVDGSMMDACMYYFEPKTDVFCVLFEFFCKPGSDVELETEDTCLIVSLGFFS